MSNLCDIFQDTESCKSFLPLEKHLIVTVIHDSFIMNVSDNKEKACDLMNMK